MNKDLQIAKKTVETEIQALKKLSASFRNSRTWEDNPFRIWVAIIWLHQHERSSLVIKVKIKNNPNNIKAIKFLGKYSQHKPLFDEVVKTLDFLDQLNKDIAKKKGAA